KADGSFCHQILDCWRRWSGRMAPGHNVRNLARSLRLALCQAALKHACWKRAHETNTFKGPLNVIHPETLFSPQSFLQIIPVGKCPFNQSPRESRALHYPAQTQPLLPIASPPSNSGTDLAWLPAFDYYFSFTGDCGYSWSSPIPGCQRPHSI